MKKTLLLSVAFALLIITITSCKKKGCTDSTAANFCSKCKAEDGQCQYEGNVVIWWNQATAQSWHSFPLLIDQVDVTIDGTLIGTYDIPATFWSTAPSCGASRSIFNSKSLGTAKTAPATVAIKSHTTHLPIVTGSSGSFTYTGGICLQLQITP